MSTPLSQIRICAGVRLNNDYQHTIWFDSYDDQKEYFTGKVVKTFPDYTYLRKNWSIKVDATMAQAQGWNYLFFSNYDSAKFYYYFINDVQYVNDNTVELFIELDVMQTYLFDYDLLPCMVDREHVYSDKPSEWLMDEALETGDLVVNEADDIDIQNLCVMILSSTNPNNGYTVWGNSSLPYFSGLGLYAVKSADFTKLRDAIQSLDDDGRESIVAMWMYPKDLVDIGVGDGEWPDRDVTPDGEEWEWGKGVFAETVRGVKSVDVWVSPEYEDIDGYEPINKKLFAHPFNFMYITNNAGGSAVYRYEFFNNYPNANCNFKLYGALSPESSVIMYPYNYKGCKHFYDEGLTGASYPTCAWNQDVYKMWLAQNQNQLANSMNLTNISAAGGILSAMSSALTLNLGGVAGGISSTVNAYGQAQTLLAQKKDMAVQPPQARGQHSSSINIHAMKQTYTIMRKSVSQEHAKRIDDYFTMYGYKCNQVKIPNRNVRERFTFTKTVGCTISGNICTSDKRKIESIYNNGVTFWLNGDLIGMSNLRNLAKADL